MGKTLNKSFISCKVAYVFANLVRPVCDLALWISYNSFCHICDHIATHNLRKLQISLTDPLTFLNWKSLNKPKLTKSANNEHNYLKEKLLSVLLKWQISSLFNWRIRFCKLPTIEKTSLKKCPHKLTLSWFGLHGMKTLDINVYFIFTIDMSKNNFPQKKSPLFHVLIWFIIFIIIKS